MKKENEQESNWALPHTIIIETEGYVDLYQMLIKAKISGYICAR